MSAQQIITQKYGQPDATYEKKYMTLWEIQKDFPWFPAHRIYLNKDFKAKLFIAFTNIQAAGLQGQITTFDGCFVHRNTRGSSVPSLHSWGMAMDISAKRNFIEFHHESDPYNHTTFSKQFVDIMIAAGLFWGGNYNSRFDPMHFSLYNG